MGRSRFIPWQKKEPAAPKNEAETARQQGRREEKGE